MKKRILMALIAIFTLFSVLMIQLDEQKVYATGTAFSTETGSNILPATTQLRIYFDVDDFEANAPNAFPSGITLIVTNSDSNNIFVIDYQADPEEEYFIYNSSTYIALNDIENDTGWSWYSTYESDEYIDIDTSTWTLAERTLSTVNANVASMGITYEDMNASSTWTVSFDSNGGTAVSDIEDVEDEATISAPSDPTKTYYTFDGWYTDDGVWTDEWIFATDTVTEDVTLYAKWVLNEWTVTYDSNGGSAKSPDDYDYDELLIEPSDPTRATYDFVGWFYDDTTFASEVDWGTDTMPNNDITLYADWELKDLFTLTYDSNGGSAVASENVYDDELATEPDDPTKLYYTFSGWFTSNLFTTEWIFGTDTVTENTTLYAQWVLQKVVTFDSNGGSVVDTQYIDDGELADEPVDPTLLGYDFDAWYTDDGTFLNEFDFGADTITADITLYANWTIHTWTVTFDSNGGSAVDSQFVDYNSVVSKPTNPTRTGYGFVGWYADEDLTDYWQWAIDMMPDESITLYARWQKDIDGVIDDFVTDADIGDTGKLAMALGAIMVTAIIFVLVGLQAVMTIMLMVIMFTLFLALGWIPGWMAVIMAIILFGMLFIIIKGNGGGSE